MATKYDASSIVVIKNDRDRVRQSPSMYVPNREKEGAIHCYFEIVDNSIDELSIPDSVGNNLEVTFDRKTKEVTVTDNGRGIPHEALFDVLTVLAASGKFSNSEESAYAASGGAFGHGLKATLFLSSYFEFSSTRNGKKLTYAFKDGLKKSETTEKAKGHGTRAKFTLDPKYIETKDVAARDIVDRLEEKSYVFPKLNIVFTILDNGKSVKTYKFGGKTMLDKVKQWNLATEPIEIHEKRPITFLKNITDDKLTEEKIRVDLVFAYSEDILDKGTDEYTISYANTIKTYAGGVHTDGVKLGIQKFFRENVIPKFKGADKELPIMPSDMVSGLGMFVAVTLSTPEFRGQEKTQLSNQEVKFAVRDAVYSALINSSNSIQNHIVDFVKRVTKGRLASKKSKKKDMSNAFSKDRPEKLVELVRTLKTVDPEIILVEGDSAADNAAIARDPYNQAIYGIGRPTNVYDKESESVNKIKSTFNDILDYCGIYAGEKCDPSDSRMNRILMMTDGDVDGDDIAISVVCLLAKHCRPLIEAGMVGRILPPAYAIPTGGKKKKRFYVRSQREFFDTILKDFINNTKVEHHGKSLSKKDLRALVEKNFEYDTRLQHLADWASADLKLMEYIAWCYHGKSKDQKKSYWMNKLKKYPSIRILMEGGMIVLDGDIPGSGYVNLSMDEHFDTRVYLFKEYQKVNSDIYDYTINGDKDKSLYDITHLMRSYIPDGVKRFKGLGELNPDEMHDICMDKDSRTVIIFKFDNFEEDMGKIDIIMSTKKEFMEARARIMRQLTIDPIDLDT